MSRHRIFGSEAGKPRPIAYIRVYPTGKKASGYVAAAVLGGLVTLVAAVVMAVLNGALLMGGG